jgi:hypothetical protein
MTTHPPGSHPILLKAARALPPDRDALCALPKGRRHLSNLATCHK